MLSEVWGGRKTKYFAAAVMRALATITVMVVTVETETHGLTWWLVVSARVTKPDTVGPSRWFDSRRQEILFIVICGPIFYDCAIFRLRIMSELLSASDGNIDIKTTSAY